LRHYFFHDFGWVVFCYFVELLLKGTSPSLLQTIVPDDCLQ